MEEALGDLHKVAVFAVSMENAKAFGNRLDKNALVVVVF